MTERLGIVYTPVEVVDFILHSVNHLLQQEFSQTLGSKGVHIIDPFTGTGTFITRLIQSGLINRTSCRTNTDTRFTPTSWYCWPTTSRPSISKRHTTAK